MSETTISRFAVPELADLADDVRARILAVQEKAGFVPNVFLMLAHRRRNSALLRLSRHADGKGCRLRPRPNAR